MDLRTRPYPDASNNVSIVLSLICTAPFEDPKCELRKVCGRWVRWDANRAGDGQSFRCILHFPFEDGNYLVENDPAIFLATFIVSRL